ncbi:chromosome partition protein MukE [Vibrio harveyi]|uniref:chromosome partition protein MukE n=1 Tax=Vibrio harveyi TaxID=669 RepID=UPI00066E6314|nr:chromosome partition protein MukE [Vibrio harveyi]
MNDQPKTYDSLIDVINDPLFSEVDAMLRAGINIIPEDNTLHSFVNAAHDHLKDYFSKVYMTLRCSPEQVYYNHMQRRTGVPQRKMSELTMVIGLTMVSMNLDMRSALENSNWVAVDHLIDRLLEKLSEDRVRELFGSRRGGAMTQFDLDKIREDVMKSMRDLQRKNFIRIDNETNCYIPTAAIYRFIDPLRGVAAEDEIPVRLFNLIKEGYLVEDAAAVLDDSDLSVDTPHWTTNIANDSPVNMDLFDSEETKNNE